MHAQTYVGRFLTLSPMVFIGKISYSLYLVHWPIVVFARHCIARADQHPAHSHRHCQHSSGDIFMGLCRAAVSLAEETPTSHPASLGWRRGDDIRSLGRRRWHFLARNPGRFGGAVQEAQVEQGTWKTGVCFLLGDPDYRAWNADACRRTSGKAQNALLWGDSFAAHYAPGLVANTSNLTANFFQYTAAGCPPILSYYSYARPHCQAFNAHVFSIIRTHDIKTVVLSARWRDMRTRGFGGLADTIAALKSAGVDVWVIGQSTEFLTDVSAIAQRNGHNQGGADAWPLAFDRSLNTKLRQAATGATFIDPLDFLCTGRLRLPPSGSTDLRRLWSLLADGERASSV
jgi:hypothetical protein